MVGKQMRGRYTQEYKTEAVRQVQADQSLSVTAQVLGIPKATLGNWVRLAAQGRLASAGEGHKQPVVTPEQMEMTRLRAEVARLTMERDTSKKSGGVLCAGCLAKYAWIEKMSHSEPWPVKVMCRVLSVSSSGYFRWRRAQLQPVDNGVGQPPSDQVLLAHIRAIHVQLKGEYGWPRMHKELQARGLRVGKERVRVLMKQHGIRARTKRKFVVTTDSKHHLPIAPDLVQRRFTPPEPNQLWSGDITYIATDEGWLYLAVVLDLHSRQVVGWSVQAHMQTSLIKDALLMACWRRVPTQGLIFHSDRGSQYCSHDFQQTLKAWGIQSSMSRKGNCWDNAPTESFFGHLKVACVLGHKFSTRTQARVAILDWIALYNHTRLHSSLGYISPMQYEQRWIAAQRKEAA